MTTKTEDIVAAVVTTLTTAGLTTRTSSDDPLAFETMPIVVVVPGGENVTALAGIGAFTYWTLELTLRIAAMGATPLLAPETYRKAAHAALYANRTLSGTAVDISATSVNRHLDGENPAAGIADCTYLVRYRTTEGVL